MRDKALKRRWEALIDNLSKQFADGASIDIEGIVYLIGIQELGNPHRSFDKREKMDIIHLAICRLLTPYGFYEYEGIDQEGWPHYKLKEKLPFLKPGEQSILMKEAIVSYFTEREYILWKNNFTRIC